MAKPTLPANADFLLPDTSVPPPQAPPDPLTLAPAQVDFDSLSDEQQAAYIARLERRKKFTEAAEADAERAQAIEMARQNVESYKRQQKQVEASQAGCSHMKEDGRRPNLVGQKDHANLPIFICQRCQKVWNYAKGDELPVMLLQMADMQNLGLIH